MGEVGLLSRALPFAPEKGEVCKHISTLSRSLSPPVTVSCNTRGKGRTGCLGLASGWTAAAAGEVDGGQSWQPSRVGPSSGGAPWASLSTGIPWQPLPGSRGTSHPLAGGTLLPVLPGPMRASPGPASLIFLRSWFPWVERTTRTLRSAPPERFAGTV